MQSWIKTKIRTSRYLKQFTESTKLLRNISRVYYSTREHYQEISIVREASLYSKGDLSEIITEFRNWLNNDVGKKHFATVEKEKQEVKELVKKLDSLEENNPEFVELVLYALLPYAKTKYAK